MPLYELYYIGWLYLLAIGIYIFINRLFANLHSNKSAAVTGLIVGLITYLIYKIIKYIYASIIYSNHSTGGYIKPWYSWIEIPQDIQLLFIYSITGIIGGWLYYRWITLPNKAAV